MKEWGKLLDLKDLKFFYNHLFSLVTLLETRLAHHVMASCGKNMEGFIKYLCACFIDVTFNISLLCKHGRHWLCMYLYPECYLTNDCMLALQVLSASKHAQL